MISTDNIIPTLEFMLDMSKNPLYNSLEVGFRHSPLTLKEQNERYQDVIDYMVLVLPEIIEYINDSLQNSKV